MPDLPDSDPTSTEATMDLRIPDLALDHIAQLRSEAERARRQRAARSDERTLGDRLAGFLDPRRPRDRHLDAQPC